MPGQGLEALKKNKRQGGSLPFVTCACAFLVAFALAIVYTSGVMLANANNKLEEERCYQLAKSFAGVVGKELQKTEAESSFRRFADKFLDDPAYNAYNPDHPETVYHYILKTGEDEKYGKVTLRLRKEFNEDDLGGMEGTIKPPIASDTNYTEQIRNLQEKQFQRHLLTVEVVVKKGNLTYNYPTEYYREDRYPVRFQYDGKDIVWFDDGTVKEWRYGTTAGAKCEFNDGSDQQITYTYDTEKPIDSRFVPVHEEGGAS
ncbi:hypothetical protein ABXS75_08290 [Roseburia hominis]